MRRFYRRPPRPRYDAMLWPRSLRFPPLTSSPYRDHVQRRYDAFATRGLALDLMRGKPSSDQLDLSNGLLTLLGEFDFTAADGSDVRNYGGLQGLPELCALLAPLFGVAPGQVVLGDNSSLALMHDAMAFAMLEGTVDSARPWGQEPRLAFLCPVPGYDRHFAITEELGFDLIPVPLGADGPDMDAVERLVATDPAVKGIWCVPKYSNPTGAVYSAATTERLAAMPTAAPDVRVFWDDAYAVHHLTAERIETPNLIEACRRHGHPQRALVFGSTSKVTLAGAGVALVAASRENVAWYLARMGKRTIGGDKINQLRHVRYLKNTAGLIALMDRRRHVERAEGRLLHHPRRARRLRRTRDSSRQGGRRGPHASRLHVSARARSARRQHPVAPTFPDLATVTTAAEGVAVSVLLAAATALLAQRESAA